jgi:hypothetical protein
MAVVPGSERCAGTEAEERAEELEAEGWRGKGDHWGLWAIQSLQAV